jgi:hypothetical protein
MRTSRKVKRVALIIAALSLAVTGTATAVITTDKGGIQVGVDKRTSDLPSSTSNLFWSDIPGASVVVSVPADQSRLYDVPFFAESQCSGAMAGTCSVRIVALNLDTNQLTVLNPQSGIDYAFDTDVPGAADDLREGHAMERSARLEADDDGTDYQIEVQYAVTNNNTVFTLDDWHLAVLANL